MSVVRSFLAPLVAATVILLAMVAGLNATVDVNGVYHNRQAFAERYIDALLRSTHGLVQVPYERLVKFELLRRAHADCYIFGSSHIMAINLDRFPALASRCGDLVNVGVSSATFEDFVIFMSAMPEERSGSTVYFEMPPWFFEENENVRWTELADAYDLAVRKFSLGNATRYAGTLWRPLNLVSASYLQRNLDKLMKGGGAASTEPEIRSAWPPQALRADDAITASDGSLTYSFSHETAPRRAGSFDLFDTPRPLVSEKNIVGLATVTRALEAKGLHLVPILMPYHPERWRCDTSSACEFLEAATATAQAATARLGLQLIGSYDPRPLGLSASDFYDDQHVVMDSLPKLSLALQHAIADRARH